MRSGVIRALALCLLLFPAACALERDYVEVRYGPARFAGPVAGASVVSIDVAARDARTTRQDRVSNKINGYGMEMAPIIATNDIVAETGRTIMAELERAGFRPGGADGRIEVEVLRFYNRFQTGFWAGRAEAEIQVNLRVLDRNGRQVFDRVYTVQGIVPAVQLANGSNAVIALQGAMEKLVQEVIGDAALMTALTRLPPSADAPRGRALRQGSPGA
jgi:uncharacterized lipoprotein